MSLQFQKFITKANDKADKWKLLQNTRCILKFSLASFNTPVCGTVSYMKQIKTISCHARCSILSSMINVTPSVYNFKNLLQRQSMRYLRQICSMYSVVIEVSITLHFRYPVDE